jgi:hypothetical protein
MVERFSHLGGECGGAPWGQFLLGFEKISQRLSIDIFHDDVWPLQVFAGVIHLHHPRMSQGCGGECFPFESFRSLPIIGQEGVEPFDDDLAEQLGVRSSPDGGHPSGPDPLLYVETIRDIHSEVPSDQQNQQRPGDTVTLNLGL